MKLKDLEKIKLIETALMLGVPIGLSLFNHNPDSANQSANWADQLFNNTHNIYVTLASIPRLADAMLTTRIELKTEDYKEIKDVYYQVVHNFSLFLEKQKMEERYKDSDEYVLLALRSLQNYIINGRVVDKNDCRDLITDEMNDTKAGAFVSIHEHGKLRGCIGTILPTTGSVADEIIQNAVSACARDPRFEPIREDEIPYLEVNVDVLTKPEKISSKDELDVKRYGVIVTHGYKRGLLLPDLDGVDTIDDQIDIARRKGGIREDEPYELERFEVVRHI